MRHRIVSWILNGLTAVGLAASLSACNMVITPEPTFLAEDQGEPALREGLWVNAPSDCEFDIKAKATTWPECAQWVVIRDHALTGVSDKGEPFSLAFVLTATDPRILQIELKDDKPTEGKPGRMYLYSAFRAVETDKKGLVVGYEGWAVLCGPPPKYGHPTQEEAANYRTPDPFPGVVMTEGDGTNCTPASKADLFKVAALSERYDEDEGQVSRWVRDGDR